MSHAAPVPPAPPSRPDEPTIGQLVASATRDMSTLIQNEIALVKSEVKVSVRAGGIGAALLAVAGFLLLLGIVLLSFAIAYFFHMAGLDLAWCYLIVFGIYAILAGIVAVVGLSRIRKVRPPERAIAQAQETKQALLNRS